MIVLSLFDGMACGYQALKDAGIYVEKYYASEIDKYAMQIAKKNHPDIIHLGDVTKWREWSIPKPDLIIGGSPCQGFSFAGKQLAFDDPRSKLFFDMIDIIDFYDPKFRFLENVKMKKEHLDIITKYMACEPHFINSALVSAQNRQRYYWYNWDAPTPDDKGIMLADIIEHGVTDRDKSFCIDANYFKGGNLEQYFEHSRRQLVFIDQRGRGRNAGGAKALDGKTPTLSSSHWQQNNHLVTAFTERRTEEAKEIRRKYQKEFGRDFSPRRAKELVAREDGKMNCLTATYSIKEHTLVDEKMVCRKLTPIECERLQTLPDNYTGGVSDTQRYKMLGNGWTKDVIAHIFSHIPLNELEGMMR